MVHVMASVAVYQLYTQGCSCRSSSRRGDRLPCWELSEGTLLQQRQQQQQQEQQGFLK